MVEAVAIWVMRERLMAVQVAVAEGLELLVSMHQSVMKPVMMAATPIFKVLRRAIPLVDEARLVAQPKPVPTMLNTAEVVEEVGEVTPQTLVA